MAYFNEIVTALYLVLDLCFLLLMFRLFGKAGLYLVVAFGMIVANVQSLKIVDLFGIQCSAGNVPYAVVFVALALLAEQYGRKEARRGVGIGVLSLLVFALFMQIGQRMDASSGSFLGADHEGVLNLLPRIALAGFVAFLVSQYPLLTLYDHMRETALGRYVWFRANAAIWMSQVIDIFVFSVIAFAGLVSMETMAQLVMAGLAVRIAVTFVGTVFLYLAIHLAPEKQVVRVWPDGAEGGQRAAGLPAPRPSGREAALAEALRSERKPIESEQQS